MSASTFRWYNKPAFDAPHLNSPQPCAHGSGCVYTVKDKESGLPVAGCCSFVHPGEEGSGRRIFDERTSTNEAGETVTQKACVRLTGKAGFYERRRLRLSWPAWCLKQGIPYTANPVETVTTPRKPRAPRVPGAPRKAAVANTTTLILPEDRDEAVLVLMSKLIELGAITAQVKETPDTPCGGDCEGCECSIPEVDL